MLLVVVLSLTRTDNIFRVSLDAGAVTGGHTWMGHLGVGVPFEGSWVRGSVTGKGLVQPDLVLEGMRTPIPLLSHSPAQSPCCPAMILLLKSLPKSNGTAESTRVSRNPQMWCSGSVCIEAASLRCTCYRTGALAQNGDG